MGFHQRAKSQSADKIMNRITLIMPVQISLIGLSLGATERAISRYASLITVCPLLTIAPSCGWALLGTLARAGLQPAALR